MKLQSNKGNAFTIVIIVLALFTIFIGTIFMQINNQIKSNKNTLDSTSAKYAAEAGIEHMAKKIIDDINSKLINKTNLPTGDKLNVTNYIKTNDKYADVKKELIKAYDELVEVNNKYNVFTDSINELYSITLNEYTSHNIMEDDIKKVKWDIIQTLAVQDISIKNEIKSKVYSIVDYISESQVILYEGIDSHTGESHGKITPVLETLGGGEIRVSSSEATKDFIDDGSNNSYRIGSIYKYVTSDLVNSVGKLESSFNEWITAKSSLSTLRYGPINVDLGNYLNQQIRNGNPNGFHEFLWYQALPNEYYEKFEKIKEGICNRIDIAIDKYLIQEVENELYRIYVEEFRSEDRTNEKISLIRDILEKFELTKKNLIELKCKLGYVDSDTSGDVILPNPPETDEEPVDELYVEVEAIVDENLGENDTDEELDENKTYGIYNVKEITKKYFNISSDNDLKYEIHVPIESTGNVNGKEYKIKANMIFTVDNDFDVDYSVESYEKINIEEE